MPLQFIFAFVGAPYLLFLFVVEEICIDFLDLVCLRNRDAKIVLDHILRQQVSVHQNHM